MIPEVLIVHKADRRSFSKIEYWSGRYWVTVRSFAKTYVEHEARRILELRFHRDKSARMVACNAQKVVL